MKGELVRTELKNPFSLVAERVKSNTISRVVDDVRTYWQCPDEWFFMPKLAEDSVVLC